MAKVITVGKDWELYYDNVRLGPFKVDTHVISRGNFSDYLRGDSTTYFISVNAGTPIGIDWVVVRKTLGMQQAVIQGTIQRDRYTDGGRKMLEQSLNDCICALEGIPNE